MTETEEATMSKKPALALVEDEQPIAAVFVDKPEVGEVAPLEEPEAESSPDLQALERVVLEATGQMVPLVSRAASYRDGMVVKARDLQNERAGYADRQELLTRQYEAAMRGLDGHIKDIDDALRYVVNGIGPGTPPEAA
jgi:hypothetical protein